MGVRIRQAQTSLIRGELSPLMAGRYDMQAFANGAKQLKNLWPLAQGGARTRPGLRFLATLGQNEGVVKAFVFNSSQRYAFVFSNGALHVYQAPTYSLVATLTSCPWTTAMLPRLSIAHFGDTMIVCHPDMEMQVIRRTGATTFTRAAFAFEEADDGEPMYQPYYKFAASDMTLKPSGTSGSITLTLSSPGAWEAGHVGAIVRYKEKEIEITAVASATSATGTVRETLAGTTADADWDEAVFNAARGWAAAATFHENRLWLFGAKSRPTGRWFSKIGAFFNFDVGTNEANEASWEAIAGSVITEGRHIVSTRHVVMFGDAGVYYQPATPANPITPDSAASPEQSDYGASYVTPASYDDALVFVTKAGRILAEARYNDVDQAYRVSQISLFAPHLVDDPFDLTVLRDSDRSERYAFFVNGDGKLTLVHMIQQQDILAMAPTDTEGTFKSVCAVGEDLLAVVEREIDGSTIWALEIFDQDAAPLDCSASATSGAPTRTFTGFTHLANATVSAYSDGHFLGTYQIDGSGALTLSDLDPELEEVEVGLAFDQVIQPMPAVLELRGSGPSRGRILSLVSVTIEVDRSDAFAVNGVDILLDFAGDNFADPPPTKTGLVTVYNLGADTDAAPVIRLATPAKVTILGLNREVEVME
jgi:hypothetical protein